MSGAELAAELPGIKTIYISGYSDELRAKHGIGTDEWYIQKPFTAENLLEKLRAALDQPEGPAISVLAGCSSARTGLMR